MVYFIYFFEYSISWKIFKIHITPTWTQCGAQRTRKKKEIDKTVPHVSLMRSSLNNSYNGLALLTNECRNFMTATHSDTKNAMWINSTEFFFLLLFQFINFIVCGINFIDKCRYCKISKNKNVNIITLMYVDRYTKTYVSHYTFVCLKIEIRHPRK
jgi:hypothetical protein